MRELSPVLRAVVNSGLLKDHLLTCYRKGRPSMTERERILHDSVTPRRGNQDTMTVSDSEHRTSRRNSSDDPSVSSTHSLRHVSSNSRVHPRASNHISDLKSRSHEKTSQSRDLKSRSHDHHHKTPKRKRSIEDNSAVWTEHVSSSGRVYFYNKKEDKSQWEKPSGNIKKPKEGLTSPVGKSSSRQTSNTSSVKASHTSTPRTHLRSQNDMNHRDGHRKPRHDHHLGHRGEGKDKERTGHSSVYRNSHSRSVSRSPGGMKHQADKIPVKHEHTGIPALSPITPKSKPVLVSPTTPASRSTPPHFIDLANRNGNPANTVDSLDLRTPTPYSSRQKLEYASHLALNGPSTPVVSVHSLMCSTQPVIMDTSGLHPLQKALMLQNQFSQQQQSYDSSLCFTPQPALPTRLSQPGSHPSSPRIQSPITRTPPILTPSIGQPIQGNIFKIPANIHVATYSPVVSMQGVVSSLQAASMHTAMSRLGYTTMDGYSFPDVSSLKTNLQSVTVNDELVDKSLVDGWTKHNDAIQSQVDGCVRNTLEVSVTDSIHISTRESVSQLRLEAVKLSTMTTDVRLSAFNSLMEEINNR
ncbi:WW domain-containing adapter protein with coiled-coil-like isoform X2 [Halichondria panicea]|uniref:WW domain-containing adapter protein with coiled-coil-like isoform X2 n=1 Tax=Halichondria panicea TaxID=6063 RepID=UPI00312B4EAC